ncbi:hypothetical protein [Helicobacter sp. 13S00477-4]|uniref:hypothetical protein n=1 Tax=Helicobacter sp. 13S00477-4 TaxID=1905759 RepID=UPI000BA78A4C|nr:hypothetical protein [Helicobacter sp. 13S00477-4]PAF50821.1 hypothetical protein BKH44_06625 [Helicobacter sp. 13S00477-4]
MKNKFKFFCLFFFGGVLYAQNDSFPDLSLRLEPYGNLKAGMQYYSYTEPKVMTVSGPMFTVSAMGGIKFNPLIKSDLEIYYATDIGQNIYHGSLVLTNPDGSRKNIPVKYKSNDYYLGGVYRLGLIIGNGIDEWLVLYTGMGYRYLNNIALGLGAYSREQSYLYMPFGGRVKVWVNNKIRLKLDAELRALLLGNNKSAFKKIGFDNDLHFTQNNGSGARVSFGAEVFISKKNIFFIQGTLDYWSIGDSNKKPAYKSGVIQGYWLEPKNNTITYGVEIGYAF